MKSHRVETPKVQVCGGILGALALLLAITLFPALASAAPLHTTPAFSPITGSGIGVTFAQPMSVGVDENNGNILVPSGHRGGETDDSVFILSGEGGHPVGIASPFKITGFNFEEFAAALPYAISAVDSAPASPSEGALYVPDKLGESVKKFVPNPGTEQYEPAGELTSVPSMGKVEAVAVDDDGNVYAASPFIVNRLEAGFGLITKFSPTGVQLARIVMTEATKRPAAVAVDSAGDVFIGTEEGKGFKFPVNGLGEIEAANFVDIPANASAQPLGLAIDRAGNTLFVPQGSGAEVAELDASSLVEKGSFSFAGDPERFRAEIAVNHTAGLIYGLQPFSPRDIPVVTLDGPTVPDTGTTVPTEVTATKATLHGVVNPQGLAVGECKFVVTNFPNPSLTLPCEGGLPTDSSAHEVSAQVTGLGIHSIHNYRLVTTNANGSNQSAVKAFSTEGIANTKAASAITGSGATLNGVVRPEGVPLDECVFEYGPTESYGTTVPCSPAAGAIPSDFEGHAVAAAISDLFVGTTYHFRVRAAGGVGAEAGGDLTFKTPGPSLGRTYVGPTTEASATLRALVNPRGIETTYRFEYGPTTAYGNVTADASAGAVDANSPVSECNNTGATCIPYAVASTLVKGLTPNTTYHFRVVVSNAEGTGTGPDATFATYDTPQSFDSCPNDAFRTAKPSATLPDCRAYEQATPVDKNGANASGSRFKVQASVRGDGITSVTKGGLPGAEGSQEEPIFLSHRDPAGTWSTQSFFPPPSFGDRATVRGWTPDLAYSFSTDAFAGSDATGNGEDVAFLARSSATHAVQQMTPYIDGATYAFAGAAADDSKFFIEARGPGVNLTGNAATGKDNLYVYDPAREELSLVGVLPDGTTPPGGSFAGPFGWWENGEDTDFGGALGSPGARDSINGYLTQEMHAFSADGSKAFFTAGSTGQVYVREGLDTEEPKTVAVSASQRAVPDPEGTKPAIFMGATPDGSIAFIASCEKLTDDSTAHSTAANTCTTSEQGMDLYAYDTASHELRDLTVDADPGAPLGAEVQGFVGASDDGSYVYFAANADLDGAGPAQVGTCEHVHATTGYSGDCNLYLWHDGSIKLATASLHAGDGISSNWFPGGAVDMFATAKVADDGRAVVFRSALPLTGYDNRSTASNCEESGQFCNEYFRYDADTDSLSCVTCSPIGAPPIRSAHFQSIELGATAFFRPLGVRFVSSNGNRVFFETADKLVSGDVNGDESCPVVRRPSLEIDSCQDVYEWEASGEGSCSEASPAYSPPNGGCLYLLSSGTSPHPSFFADASASGNDVFIFTDQQLVPGDDDELFDVYDVRVGGGLASQNQPPPPSPCEGEACRAAATAPPSAPSAGSASFQGPGNPPVKRCGKGKVAKGKKCVKKHKPRRHHKHRAKRRHHKHAAKKSPAGTKRGGSK